MFKALKHQYLAAIWAILVLILSDMPLGDQGKYHFFEGFDKLVHTGFYFVFTVLLLYGKIREQRSYSYRIETVIKIILLNVVLGGGIEILQWQVFTWRSGDWWDFACDMVGVGMGIFSYIFLHRTRYSDDKMV